MKHCLQSLKAKYFKNSHPLHAQKREDSTWSWKSVSSEFNFIKKFSFWSIGNGTRVLIWQDKWIFHLDSPPTPSSTTTNPYVYKYVSELIDENTKSWRAHLVIDLFDPGTAEMILSMRIPRYSEDKLCWTLTKNGNFTFKSAYYALYNIKYHNGLATYKPHAKNIWRKVWSMDAIPRVKLFIWKCIKDIIPSKERLSRRIWQEDVLCSSCKCSVESTMHILTECDYARAVWFIAGYRQVNNSWNNQKDWITTWFPETDAAIIIKMSIICWLLWKERCDRVFENKTKTPQQLIHTINRFLLSAESFIRKENNDPKIIVAPKWQHPDIDFIKLNTDASYCGGTKMGGYGLIFRNDAGAHVASKCRGFTGELDVHHLESLAILEGLKWGRHLGIKKIIIESDYYCLIQAILGEASDIPWEMRGIVEDICFHLRYFDFYSCKHINRLANKCADKLAKHA